MTKCKHMKKIKFENISFCVCQSKKGGDLKYNPRYSNIIRRFGGMYVMGGQNRTKEPNNWWELCVNGKDPLSGLTPSKCAFYIGSRKS